jgi:two-component system, chemotaxis family, chemotaxis protein CheY
VAKPILIVDDDAATREFIRQALDDEGYAVLVAADGQQALEIVNGSEPGLILLDAVMPRIDGMTFAHLYRARLGPHAPIVALTASLDPVRAANNMLAAATLAKPFDLDELLGLVARLLNP